MAPATANIIAKMAHGLADDLLSTTLLAAQAPIIVCPAMNTGMYENAFTQENITCLKAHGITVMDPATGFWPAVLLVLDVCLSLLKSWNLSKLSLPEAAAI